MTETVYTIKKGDTLTKIAAQYHTTVKELERINDIKNSDLIFAGDELKVPDTTSEEVTLQDTTPEELEDKLNAAQTEVDSIKELVDEDDQTSDLNNCLIQGNSPKTEKVSETEPALVYATSPTLAIALLFGKAMTAITEEFSKIALPFMKAKAYIFGGITKACGDNIKKRVKADKEFVSDVARTVKEGAETAKKEITDA